MNYSDTYTNLLKYKQEKGGEYPEWYAEHLANNQPVNIDKF